MTLRQNTAEGQTSGTTLSVANSGGGSGDAFTVLSGAGIVAFSNAQAMHGTQSYLVNEATSNVYLAWATGINAASAAMRIYLRLNSIPTSTQDLAIMLNSAAGSIKIQVVATTGQVRIARADGGAATTFATGMSVNTWYRIEAYAAAGTTTSNGTIQAAYYVGDSATPVNTAYSSAVANAGTTNFTSFRVFKPTGSVALNAYFDDIGFNDGATGLIGPYVASTAYTGDAAPASTVTVSADGNLGKSADATSSSTVTVAASGSTGYVSGDAPSSTVSVAAAGSVGKSSTATSAVTVAVTTSGAVTVTTGAAPTPTVTVSTAGVVGKTSTAAPTATVTVAAAGVVTAASAGASTPTATVTVTTAGAVTKTGTTSPTTTVTVSADGTVRRNPTGDTSTATTVTVTATGSAGRRAGAAQDTTVTIAADGAVTSNYIGDAATTTAVTIDTAGQVGTAGETGTDVAVTITASGTVTAYVQGRDITVTIVGPYHYPVGIVGPHVAARPIVGPYHYPLPILGPLESTA